MSSLSGKYINPLTDFGFKKLFGSEPNKELLIDFLNQILPEKHQIQDLTYSRNEQMGTTEIDRKAVFEQDRPEKLQERIFEKLFSVAEVAKFTPKERKSYEDSLKYYRDIKNVVDTSRGEGVLEGIQ